MTCSASTPAVIAIRPTHIGQPMHARASEEHDMRDTTSIRYAATLMEQTRRLSRGALESMKDTLSVRHDDATLRTFTELRLECVQPTSVEHTLQVERQDPVSLEPTRVHTEEEDALDLSFQSRTLTFALMAFAALAALGLIALI